MTHAPRGGRRRFPSSLYDGLSPIDALNVRDELANNALHAADEAVAKCLVNVKAPDSSLIAGTPQTYLTGDLEVTGDWYLIAPYGPFGLSVFEGGTPYSLVLEVFAKSSAASAVNIGIEIAPDIRPDPAELRFATGRNSQEWTTSSTSTAWLTSVSGSSLIVPTPSAWREVARGTTDVAGGEPREVLQCEFFINVYGKGTLGTAEPQIHGLLIREYVGK